MTDTQLIDWLQANAATVYFRFDGSVKIVTRMQPDDPGDGTTSKSVVAPNLREAIETLNAPTQANLRI